MTGGSPRPPVDRALVRRRFVELVVSIVVFDAIIIAIWYVLRVREMPPRTQLIFGWGWMLSTLLVVGVGMKRFRAARGMGRRRG
jgi:hypothetical protein